MLAILDSIWVRTLSRTEGWSSEIRLGSFSLSANKDAMSLLTASHTPAFGLGNRGSGGIASPNSAPTTVVARMSPVAAVAPNFDPGGFGDGAPLRMPVSEVRIEFSYIFGSVLASTTFVTQKPSGGTGRSSWQLPQRSANSTRPL